jgi:hypothetical protein
MQHARAVGDGINLQPARAQVEAWRSPTLWRILHDEHPGHSAIDKVMVMVSPPLVWLRG